MYAVKAFLGFKNKLGVNKQRKKETEDVIKFLFLVVFACAYAYLPSSVGSSKEDPRPVPKRKTVRKAPIEVFPKTNRNLKSKHMKRCVGKESRQQKCHYLDEPMCELLRNVKYSKINSRKSLRKSVLPYIVRRTPNRINFDDEKNSFVREMSDSNKVKCTEDVNPNSNYDLSTINSSFQPVMFSPKKQWARDVVFPNEVMNPNSVKMLKSKLCACPLVGNKKNNDTLHLLVQPKEKKYHEKKSKNCVPVQTENFPSQQQQNEEDGINEAVRQIELQNQKLERSVLENQERINQIRSKNDHLQECVTEKEDQLQEKDDLILRLQMQMMNWEPVSAAPVDIEACASMIRQEQKEEMNREKKTWLNRQLQTEKRIGDLVNAVEREKERVEILNSKAVGSEGQLWSEENETDSLLHHEPGSPLRSQVECVGSLMSAQQEQMKTTSHFQRTMDFNSKVGNPLSEIELLKERNRKLELQLSQSDRIIGELNGEKRELEFVKAQLTLQLEEEPGRENINFNKTQAQHQAEPGQRDTSQEIIAPRPKKSKLLSMSRLLSCRKVDINRNANRCEKRRKRVITMTSSPELGQP